MKNTSQKILSLSAVLLIFFAVIFGIMYVLEIKTLEQVIENFTKIIGVIGVVAVGSFLLSLVLSKK